MQGTLWTDSFLDSMRQVGDPLADAAVAELIEQGQVDRVNLILRDFDRNCEEVPADLPPLMRRYLTESGKLPAWADRQKIEQGNDLLGRYAPQMITILHCQSLPTCYAWAKAVNVLYLSQRIHQQAFRRIMETAQFILDVMDEGGLGPRGHGLRSAQKIRLLHTTIRRYTRQHPEWNPDWDLPVNQEDLAATMFTFSVILPQGLVRLGVELPERDRDNLFHIWSVIGFLLGIDERLIPKTFEEAVALGQKMLARHAAATEAGRLITKALLDYMREMLPGTALDGSPASMMRHLCGDALCDLIGVPPANWTTHLMTAPTALTKGFGKLGDHVPIAAKLASQVGLLLLKGSIRATSGGARYEWRIPKSVSERW